MKSLIAIMFLINVLGFFMYSHVQKQAELKSDQAQKELSLPLDSPQPLLLLPELSAAELQALHPDPEKTTESADEPSIVDVVPLEVER